MLSHRLSLNCFLIICLCGLLLGCGDGKKDSISSKVTDVSPVLSLNKNLVPARKFPTGKFKATESIVEAKDGRTFRASELDLFDCVAHISSIGENRIKIQIFAKLRKTPNHETKQDNRLDYYLVHWSDDSHGKLIGEDQFKQEANFTIENGLLIMKAWISRHNALETQIYDIGKKYISKP
jgi:hypothetical protein